MIDRGADPKHTEHTDHTEHTVWWAHCETSFYFERNDHDPPPTTLQSFRIIYFEIYME